MTRTTEVRVLERVYALVALFVLVAGAAVYLLAREADAVAFIPGWIARGVANAGLSAPAHVVAIAGQLPTFLHTWAFILLGLAVTAPWPRLTLPVCLLWLAAELLSELAQHETLVRAIAVWSGSPAEAWPALLRAHAAGHFDALDMLAACLGAAAAISTARMTHRFASRERT